LCVGSYTQTDISCGCRAYKTSKNWHLCSYVGWL
jgi:hypothetical protein